MSRQRLACGGSWPCGLWLLLLLLSYQQEVSAATAYLVGSMQQPYEASNSSYNNLYDILQQIDSYNTIVLSEDYAIRNPQQLAQRDPVRLSQDLLITSAPGEQNQLDFAFLVGPKNSRVDDAGVVLAAPLFDLFFWPAECCKQLHVIGYSNPASQAALASSSSLSSSCKECLKKLQQYSGSWCAGCIPGVPKLRITPASVEVVGALSNGSPLTSQRLVFA